MKKLSGVEHWDAVHEREQEQLQSTQEPDNSQPHPSVKKKIVALLKRVLGKRGLEYMGSYDEHLFWNVILEKHLPKRSNVRVLEVGSAPGNFLVKFSQKFDCIPYGVEYSHVGAALNREVFKANGIDQENVIHADFFSDDFHQRYQGYFDIVISRGFIEHFTDVKSVVDKHINLLADKGCLVISIPNLKGANYYLTKLFNKELIPIHNLDIMSKQSFSELFDPKRLTAQYCDYYGVFSFYLFDTTKDSRTRKVLMVCNKVQPLLNAAFRLVFGNRGARSRAFSPYLIFMGTKSNSSS